MKKSTTTRMLALATAFSAVGIAVSPAAAAVAGGAQATSPPAAT